MFANWLSNVLNQTSKEFVFIAVLQVYSLLFKSEWLR